MAKDPSQTLEQDKPELVAFTASTAVAIGVGLAATVASGGNVIIGGVAAGMVGNLTQEEIFNAMERKRLGLPQDTSIKNHVKEDLAPVIGGAVGGVVAGGLGGAMAANTVMQEGGEQAAGAVTQTWGQWIGTKMASLGLGTSADISTEKVVVSVQKEDNKKKGWKEYVE